jgi:hypothetical protein
MQNTVDQAAGRREPWRGSSRAHAARVCGNCLTDSPAWVGGWHRARRTELMLGVMLIGLSVLIRRLAGERAYFFRGW